MHLCREFFLPWRPSGNLLLMLGSVLFCCSFAGALARVVTLDDTCDLYHSGWLHRLHSSVSAESRKMPHAQLHSRLLARSCADFLRTRCCSRRSTQTIWKTWWQAGLDAGGGLGQPHVAECDLSGGSIETIFGKSMWMLVSIGIGASDIRVLTFICIWTFQPGGSTSKACFAHLSDISFTRLG